MRRAILVAVALSCFVMGKATAAAYDGNKLFEFCEKTDDVSFGFCFGYVSGVVDATFDEGHYCWSAPGVKSQQLKDVVTLWLRDHPEKRHLPADELVATALKEKFPCN